MDFEALTGKVGIYLASFVVGFVSGLVPFVNSEIYLVAVSSVAARPALMPIALLVAAGQMVAKTILFYAGQGVFKINMGKYQSKVEAVQDKFVRWKNKTDALIFMSAALGLPPFYVVSFVAGALKLNVIKFVVVGLVGRGIRFAALVYFPQFVLKYV